MNASGLGLPAVAKRDRWVVLSLFFLGVLSRLPFRSRLLHHWDSVNFALAIERFDVRLHQPHPPGTFVIYVLLGRLADWFLKDPNSSLVWISILTSGMSAAFIFVLGTWWFERRTGVTIAALMLVSPLIWFHGEVALSNMLEFFWVILVVLLCAAFHQGSERAFWASALCLGLAGGIRPNTPVFMFPLWMVLALKCKKRLREIIVAFAIMAVGVLLWAVPMVVMSGGPIAYWEAMRWWTGQHLEKSEEANLLVYLARFGMYTLYALGVALVAVGWALCRYWRCLWRWLRTDWRAQILLAWVSPGVAYSVFVHLKQPGHTFTIMPAFIVLAGLAVAAMGRYLSGRVQRMWVIVTGVLVVCNALLFLIGPPRLFGSMRSVFSTPTWATIREHDVDVSGRLMAIRRAFAPKDTAVLAGSRHFRLPDFYLRDYQMPSLSHEIDTQPVDLPEHVRVLVLFDDSVLLDFPDGLPVQSLLLPGGGQLRYVTWSEGKHARVSQSVFELID